MWGTVTIDGIPFRETITASDGDSLTLAGQESFLPSPSTYVRAVHGNVRGLRGRVVPVSVSDKSQLSGFYQVTRADSTLTDHANGAVVIADWSIELTRLGTERDVEFESRVPTVGRLTTIPSPPAARFWHAAPVGVKDYFTGATVPASTFTRASAEGLVTVQSGIPADVAPRWTVGVDDAVKGSARVVIDGYRRAGLDTPDPGTTWEVNNGIVRLTKGSFDGTFAVSAWSGSAWVSMASFMFWSNIFLDFDPEFTILRNDLEEVTIRLTYPTVPGRITCDLTLRRGSRFVTGIFKRHSAAYVSLAEVDDTGVGVTGGIRRSANDSNGNRWVSGSSRNVELNLPEGAIGVPSVTMFDFFVGHEVNATAPGTGNAFADLLAQYLGTTGDRTTAVRR